MLLCKVLPLLAACLSAETSAGDAPDTPPAPAACAYRKSCVLYKLIANNLRLLLPHDRYRKLEVMDTVLLGAEGWPETAQGLRQEIMEELRQERTAAVTQPTCIYVVGDNHGPIIGQNQGKVQTEREAKDRDE